MKLSIDASLQRQAENFSDELASTMQESGSAPPGWIQVSDKITDFASDQETLAAFTIAGKYLQSTDFGRLILEEWRDERADFKAYDPNFVMADFMDELGYLENFKGRNLTQLVKYYLSPAAIVDAGWDHLGTYENNDRRLRAYLFCPISFREHDGIMWFQEIATGGGIAIRHDEL